MSAHFLVWDVRDGGGGDDHHHDNGEVLKCSDANDDCMNDNHDDGLSASLEYLLTMNSGPDFAVWRSDGWADLVCGGEGCL